MPPGARRTPLLLIAVLLGLGPVCAGPSAAPACIPARPVAPAHLNAARSLMRDVPPERTRYQHRPSQVRWAEDEGGAACRTDCSGLVNAVLARGYGLTAEHIATWLGRGRPLAREYAVAIAAGRGFAPIDGPGATEPGDIIAVRTPPDNANTGHVMIVDGRAERIEPRPPLAPGTVQWAVEVIDATSSAHGNDDTRVTPDGASRSGLGRGTVRLYADRDGRLAGWAWSLSARTVYQPAGERPIAIGRVNEAALPGVTTVPGRSGSGHDEADGDSD